MTDETQSDADEGITPAEPLTDEAEGTVDEPVEDVTDDGTEPDDEDDGDGGAEGEG